MVGAQKVESLRSQLGFRVAREILLPAGVLIPEMRARWAHEFKDDSRAITAAFIAGGLGPFNSTATSPDRNSANLGVTVNALCPGAFGTEMNRPLLDDPVKYQDFVRKIPMGRWGEVEELAGAAVFLASSASSYMTGSSLFIDGGWSVW